MTTPKLLADLIALVLSDNDKEAGAALSALRRRAAQEAVTGGALKAAADRLLDVPPVQPALDALHGRIGALQEDLERARALRNRAELALTDSQRANQTLALRIGRSGADRRRFGTAGFALGVVCALVGWAGYGRLAAPPVRVLGGSNPALDAGARTTLLEFLHSCFLSSVNNMAGTAFDMHVLLDVDAAGQVAGFTMAPGQGVQLGDPDRRLYSELVARTFAGDRPGAGGSCGTLPLPASLHGRASRLDLYLSR